ncbi:MAG: sugar phosphate isomerase/epimerase [Victivallales bacterium]|nr:sugar phosphate isomerase/epimerase [Victivallales bacterium]
MHRVGIVSYSFEYSLGIFGYQDRTGGRFDVLTLLEKIREAGGDTAQLPDSMFRSLSDDELNEVQRKALDLDLQLEMLGGVAWNRGIEGAMHRARRLGCDVVGCTFGIMTRPNTISTLAEWDEYLVKCRARYAELLDTAAELDLKLAIENHLDFTVEELRDMVRDADSPHAGVLLDVGNPLGTLDDPTAAADILGPYVVATHVKDFAVEDTTRGFRLTMVPLGAGSLRLPAIIEQLKKHISPDVNFAVELLNGQQLEINWLEDRFWVPFRNSSARQVAGALRHVRGKAIDGDQFLSLKDVEKLPYEEHLALELDRATQSVSHLKALLAEPTK